MDEYRANMHWLIFLGLIKQIPLNRLKVLKTLNNSYFYL